MDIQALIRAELARRRDAWDRSAFDASVLPPAVTPEHVRGDG
jgi:hypothetical protein